jgi:hypothetical protein
VDVRIFGTDYAVVPVFVKDGDEIATLYSVDTAEALDKDPEWLARSSSSPKT